MSQQRFFATLDSTINHGSHGDTAQPFFYTTYNRPSRLRITFVGPGRTKQSFKAECDINNIMKRYQQSGVIQHLKEGEPQFVDATGYDYQSAMQIVAQARSMFEQLPAHTRARFENNPAKLLDFAHDPANIQEAVQMGLVDPKRLPEALQRVARGEATLTTQKPAKPPEKPLPGDSVKPGPNPLNA